MGLGEKWVGLGEKWVGPSGKWVAPYGKWMGGNHVEMEGEEGQLIGQYFASNCLAIWTVPCELLELGYHSVEQIIDEGC